MSRAEMGACLCMSTASRFQSATADVILNPFPAFRSGNQEVPMRGYAGPLPLSLKYSEAYFHCFICQGATWKLVNRFLNNP
ncbi:hypothetical protein BDQ94DRAFT_138692, partial [Aspergillus welwitschiae]